MTRGGTSSNASIYLSKAISRAFTAYNLHEDVDDSLFYHVYLHIIGQTNSINYSIFAIKYMEMWNGATLVKSISRVSPTLVYLQVFIILI